VDLHRSGNWLGSFASMMKLNGNTFVFAPVMATDNSGVGCISSGPVSSARLRKEPARKSARRRSQRSQALVEFALVSPLFFLIIFAAIDITRILYAYTAISSAARDGARTASLSGSLFSDCQIIKELELVGQGFPVRMDPNSLVGDSDPNAPSGALQPTTPPANVGYAYIWPAVATAAPADNYCTSSVQRAIAPSVKHVAVEVQYHFTPLLPFVAAFAPNVIIKTVSVVTTE
jgi:TadE-like protein